VQSDGAPAAAGRFSKVLAVALMDHGLEMEPDRNKAEAVVRVHAEEKTGPRPVYAKMLIVKLATRGGKPLTLDACQYTSEQRTTVDRSWTYPDRVYLVQELRKMAPELATLYLAPIQDDKNSNLTNALKAELMSGGYALAPDREHADATVEGVTVRTGELPFVALQQHLSVEATVDGWTGYSYTTNTERNVYQPLAAQLPDEVKACASSVESYTRNNDRDLTWDAAARLAASLAQGK
jgi:hypothetical protein